MRNKQVLERESSNNLQDFALFLLDYAITIMRAGANVERTVRNTVRIGKAYGYDIQLAIFLRNITMSVSKLDDPTIRATYIKRQEAPHLSFALVNTLSELSWRAFDTKMTFDELKNEYNNLIRETHIDRILILLGTAAATAAFCRLFKGDMMAVLTVFISTMIAFAFRLYLIRMKIDLVGIMFATSLVASLIALDFGYNILPTQTPDIAVSTSVLFLIPGVHIINAVIDILDGHIITGVARGVSTIILLSAIAVGVQCTIFIGKWLNIL